MSSELEVVYATTTTNIGTPDGGHHVVRMGEHWYVDDPVVQAAERLAPGLFTKDPRYGARFSVPPREAGEAPIEQVTAGPGEKRSGQIRRG